MKFSDFMIRECTQIILRVIRVKGRLTYISNESSINRSFLNEERSKELHFYQLVRLLAATSDCLRRGHPLTGITPSLYSPTPSL